MFICVVKWENDSSIIRNLAAKFGIFVWEDWFELPGFSVFIESDGGGWLHAAKKKAFYEYVAAPEIYLAALPALRQWH